MARRDQAASVPRSAALNPYLLRERADLLRQVLSYYIDYVDSSFNLPIRKKHHRDIVVDAARYQQAKSAHRGKFIPRADYERFLSVLRESAERDPQLAVYYFLAAFQLRIGVRIGEACALSWRDIDFETRTIAIHQTVHWSRKKGFETRVSPMTKTGETREIPLVASLAEPLTEWARVSGRSNGLIFSVDGFRPLTYRSIQYRYDHAFKKAGVQFRSTHILRHTFATDFLEHTSNQAALKEILGHANLSQTEQYAKVTWNLRQTGLEKYDESLKSGASVISIESALLRNAGK